MTYGVMSLVVVTVMLGSTVPVSSLASNASADDTKHKNKIKCSI